MIKIKGSKGFTLIELMITLSVVAILAAIAAPSFSQMLRDHRLTTRANDFLAELQLAKSESIRRGVQVTMLSSSGTDEVWDDGWVVFTDWDGDESRADPDANADNDCEVEDLDCFLRVQDSINTTMTIRSGGTFARWISFDPIGEVRGSGGLGNGTFVICDTGVGKRVILSTSGSARVVDGEGAGGCP